MNLDAIGNAASKALGLRFNLVSLLPSWLLVLFFVALFSSGAPSDRPSIGNTLAAAGKLAGPQIAIVFLGALVAAVLLQPFQIRSVQLLEGYWGTSLIANRARDIGVELQCRRLATLRADRWKARIGKESSHRLLQQQSAERQRLYPVEADLLPTQLGNILRSAERRAGERYGLATVSTFPRLYPVMSERLTTAVDDFTAQVDAAAQLCMTLGVATIVSVVVLLPYDFWLLVPTATAILAWFAYRGAMASAVYLGRLYETAFDLHRFDLLVALHQKLPPDPVKERVSNAALSQFLKHSDASTAPCIKRYDHS